MSVPVKPDSKQLKVQGNIHISYCELGPDSGYPVLFLQGSGPGASGWLNFRFNAQAFADAGYRVIVPDLPGFGDSDKPDTDYTLDFFVQGMLEFADQLDLNQFALVGNSLGGAVSIGLALTHPSRVSHLILMGCGGLEDQLTYFKTMSGIQAMTRIPLDSPDFTPAYLKEVLQLIVHDPAFITDELVAERFRVLQTQNSSVFKRMAIPNLTERLSDITQPVLGFWGGQDKFCPVSGAEKIVTRCPNAQMITLSQCGHWAMIEHADLFNQRSLEFLETNAV